MHTNANAPTHLHAYAPRTQVGSGVKDFFYEPAKGLVVGPREFLSGVAKGTSSLGTGVVHGTLNSVAGVGNTLNRNLAMLSLDAEYQARYTHTHIHPPTRPHVDTPRRLLTHTTHAHRHHTSSKPPPGHAEY